MSSAADTVPTHTAQGGEDSVRPKTTSESLKPGTERQPTHEPTSHRGCDGVDPGLPAHTAVAQDAESKQPRKASGVQISEAKADDPNCRFEFKTSTQEGPGTKELLAELSQDSRYSEDISTSPQSSYRNCESADDQDDGPGLQHVDYNASDVTTLPSGLEEQREKDAEKVGNTPTARNGSMGPHDSSRTTVYQDPFVERAFIQGWTQGKARSTSVNESENFHATSSPASRGTVETPRVTELPGSTCIWEAEQRALEMERLHHEEKGRLLALAKAERDNRELWYKQQLEELRSENQNLLRLNSVASSRMAEPHTKMRGHDNSAHHRPQAIFSQCNEEDCVPTLSADLVARWRVADALKDQQIASARRESEKLRLDLSAAAIREVELRQRCGATVDSFAAEVARWLKPGGTTMRHVVTTAFGEAPQGTRESNVAKELATLRSDADRLRTQLSSANSQLADLQKDYKAQSQELDSVRELINLLPLGTGNTMETVGDQLRYVLELRNKQIEELCRDLTTSTSRIDELQKSNEALSRDFGNLRDELKEKTSQHEHTVTSLNTEIGRLKGVDIAKANQIAAALKQVEGLEHELSVSASQLAEPRGHYQTQSHKVSPEQDSLCDEVGRKSKNDEKLRRDLGLLKDCQYQTMEIQQRYEKQSKEFKECQSQLDALQRFTTKADVHTDTSINQMLQKLNAEVQQNTTFIAEFILEHSQPRVETLTGEQMAATERVSTYVGQKLADCLMKDVALYLQIAFQAYLSYHLCGVISSWTTDERNSKFIKDIYRRLQEKETQMISRNWQSLTRAYISPTCSSDPQPFISSAITRLSDIVMAAGCAASVSAAKSMLSPFKDKMISMISIAGQISKMIGEVVSGDFQAFAVGPDEMFEEIRMEEDMDDQGKEEVPRKGTAVGQKVLCSTYLGLMKREPSERGRKAVTVTKAKVLLESFLDG